MAGPMAPEEVLPRGWAYGRTSSPPPTKEAPWTLLKQEGQPPFLPHSFSMGLPHWIPVLPFFHPLES